MKSDHNDEVWIVTDYDFYTEKYSIFISLYEMIIIRILHISHFQKYMCVINIFICLLPLWLSWQYSDYQFIIDHIFRHWFIHSLTSLLWHFICCVLKWIHRTFVLFTANQRKIRVQSRCPILFPTPARSDSEHIVGNNTLPLIGVAPKSKTNKKIHPHRFH